MRWLGAGSDTPRPWLPHEQSDTGNESGVQLTVKGEKMAAKTASADGTYTLGTGKYRVKQGDPLPDGAEFTANADAPKPEKRAKKDATENRVKAESTENRSAK